jgi:HTH-type transcriptional regulator, transcriptional repressor of NAD biosynthesis genes
MKNGIVIGKFYPPHKGHKYLIDFATGRVDQLTVIVCDLPSQKIQGEVRAQWLRKIHPGVKVIVVDDIGKDDDSKAWAEYTLKFLGYKPDLVFSSENYGFEYARYLGCDHVLVDIERANIPVSATRVRANYEYHSRFVEPVVRAGAVKRVCILGAESTGTTTLSMALARHFQTTWVPEFGRFYTESKLILSKDTWTTEDFEYIAQAQNQLEDNLALQANKILICDTDSFATSIWQERYLNFVSEKVIEMSTTRFYDLYILAGDEIPFVQDGIRDGEHIRHEMHQTFLRELKRLNKPFVLVTGSKEERLAKAVAMCEVILTQSILN